MFTNFFMKKPWSGSGYSEYGYETLFHFISVFQTMRPYSENEIFVRKQPIFLTRQPASWLLWCLQILGVARVKMKNFCYFKSRKTEAELWTRS
jgi:hypothetical protein